MRKIGNCDRLSPKPLQMSTNELQGDLLQKRGSHVWRQSVGLAQGLGTGLAADLFSQRRLESALFRYVSWMG